jgi:subtilisin family serine protease
MGHFLSDAPAAAGDSGRQRAAAGGRAGREPRRAAPPASTYFARLGVAVGYVDRGGVRGLTADPAVAGVFHADPLSLIRPVRVAAARARARQTWGLRRLGIRALWDQGLTGSGVRVGHLDTGVDGSHPALRGRIAGFMEFDFDGRRVPGSAPHDTAAHGTHTAGTICGAAAGGLRIGVAPEAELYSGLVIEGGNALLRVLAGMEWALENQVRVLNMSLGFRGYTPFFLAVTRRLRERGVLPVFAIGNEGPGTSRSPGNYAEALSVGAIDRDGAVAWFSSSIAFHRPVESHQPNVVAPGVGVVSAKPGGGVQSMDGTSMATPHVAGVAALLLEAQPAATVDQVEHAIQSTCTPLPHHSPLRSGFGLLNPCAALRALG